MQQPDPAGKIKPSSPPTNVTASDSFIEQVQQQINVQEVGLFTNFHDIEQNVLNSSKGTAPNYYINRISTHLQT